MPEQGITPQYKYTSEVADRLGVTRNSIIVALHRSKNFQKPAKNSPGDYIWTEEDIARYIEYRNRRRKQ